MKGFFPPGTSSSEQVESLYCENASTVVIIVIN